MTNSEKANVYDECLRESDMLQRQISRLKSQYAGNPPDDVMVEIRKKEQRIGVLVRMLESLFD